MPDLVSRLLRCWRFPSRFTMSRKQMLYMMLFSLILTLFGFAKLVYDMLYVGDIGPKDSISTICKGMFVGVLALSPLLVVLWIISNVKPGLGYIYLRDIGEYYDIEYAASYYRSMIRKLKISHDQAQRRIRAYPARLNEYQQLDADLTEQCRRDMSLIQSADIDLFQCVYSGIQGEGDADNEYGVV